MPTSDSNRNLFLHLTKLEGRSKQQEKKESTPSKVDGNAYVVFGNVQVDETLQVDALLQSKSPREK